MELFLSSAKVGALLRSGADLREAAEHHARLAERVGDESEVADSYISLGLHYTVSRPPRPRAGAAGVGGRDGARGARQRLLTRALVNLNADWTHDDAERAAEIGREAVAASTTLGDLTWISSACVNLMLATLVSGEWDEAMALLDEGLLEGPDRVPRRAGPMPDPACPRGELRALADLDSAQAEEDLAVQACDQAVRAVMVLAAGDRDVR